jgi:hypothetical protein
MKFALILKNYEMRTNILIKCHVRSVTELELIAECERRLNEWHRMIEAKEKDHNKYWQWTMLELRQKVEELNNIKQRLTTWYWQTLNKILYYSNK